MFRCALFMMYACFKSHSTFINLPPAHTITTMSESPAQQHEYQGITTFTRQPSVPQVFSYLAILIQSLTFYLAVSPSLSSQPLKVGLIVVYSASLGVAVVTTFISSYTDPSDSVLILTRKGMLHQDDRQASRQYLYCQYCRSYVSNSARHCRVCERCVQNFDHHCIWINNCIGGPNYRAFIAMIFSVFVNLLIFMAAVACLTAEHGWPDFLPRMIWNWVYLGVIAILGLLLMNLIVLHVYLGCKGYTTYQFLMMRRQAERQEELRRMEEEAVKNREAKQRQATALQMGSYGRSNQKQQQKQQQFQSHHHQSEEEKNGKNNFEEVEEFNHKIQPIRTELQVVKQNANKIKLKSKMQEEQNKTQNQRKQANKREQEDSVIFAHSQREQQEEQEPQRYQQFNEGQSKDHSRKNNKIQQQELGLPESQQILQQSNQGFKVKEEEETKDNSRSKNSKVFHADVKEGVRQSLRGWENLKKQQELRRKTNDNFRGYTKKQEIRKFEEEQDSSVSSQIKISPFFVRNKSFSFLISGTEDVSLPIQINQNSYHLGKKLPQTTRAHLVVAENNFKSKKKINQINSTTPIPKQEKKNKAQK